MITKIALLLPFARPYPAEYCAVSYKAAQVDPTKLVTNIMYFAHIILLRDCGVNRREKRFVV